MSTKLICDYCVRPIEGGYTTMAVTTVEKGGVTAKSETDTFEFHARCYNTLQGLIEQLRSASPPRPLDPTPGRPQEQPVDDLDPDPPTPGVAPVATEPAPETAPGSAASPAPTDG
jgi:hypothetical protein